MNYITYFKDTGYRITSIIPGIHFIEDDNQEEILNDYLQEFNAAYYAELTEDEHNKLLSGNYIYLDGSIKPAPLEERQPTEEEIARAKKLEYERQLQHYKELLASALLMGDNNTLKSLQEEYREFLEYYSETAPGETQTEDTEAEVTEDTAEEESETAEVNNEAESELKDAVTDLKNPLRETIGDDNKNGLEANTGAQLLEDTEAEDQ